MLTKWLMSCNACHSTGEVTGIGFMTKTCEVCKRYRKIEVWYSNKFKKWIKNPFKTTPVAIPIVIFLIVLAISIWNFEAIILKNLISPIITLLVGCFSLIFVGLKYKLDKANYQKDLFEKRYKVFTAIHDILLGCFQNESWRESAEKIKLIYNKSYFLFSKETDQFIRKVWNAVSLVSHVKEQDHSGHLKTTPEFLEAYEFLIRLIDGLNFTKNFHELKIDFY